MNAVIARAVPADAKEIFAIEREIFSEARILSDIERYIGLSQSSFFTARADGELIGYILVFGDDIITIAVKEEYKRGGVGSLLTDAVKRVREELFLEVRESNTRAIAFYLKNGFRAVGVRKRYYSDSENAIVMSWRRN